MSGQSRTRAFHTLPGGTFCCRQSSLCLYYPRIDACTEVRNVAICTADVGRVSSSVSVHSVAQILSEPTLARWLADRTTSDQRICRSRLVSARHPFLLCLGFSRPRIRRVGGPTGISVSIPLGFGGSSPRLHGIRPCRRHGHRCHLQVIHSVDDGLVPPVEHPHGHQDRKHSLAWVAGRAGASARAAAGRARGRGRVGGSVLRGVSRRHQAPAGRGAHLRVAPAGRVEGSPRRDPGTTGRRRIAAHHARAREHLVSRPIYSLYERLPLAQLAQARLSASPHLRSLYASAARPSLSRLHYQQARPISITRCTKSPHKPPALLPLSTCFPLSLSAFLSLSEPFNSLHPTNMLTYTPTIHTSSHTEPPCT